MIEFDTDTVGNDNIFYAYQGIIFSFVSIFCFTECPKNKSEFRLEFLLMFP